MRALFLITIVLSIWPCAIACAASDDEDDASYTDACPGVSLAPLRGTDRTDRGIEGLGVLRADIERSRKTFDQLSEQHAGNYRYQTFLSSWVGFTCTTEITVQDGVVVRRAQSSRSQPTEPTTLDWVEEGDALGTHSGCAEPVTLDALYDECLSRALCSDPHDNYLYVETDAQGVLKMCGVFPVNCQDDCYEGANLDWVVFD
jgi:hypothetical protein